MTLRSRLTVALVVVTGVLTLVVLLVPRAVHRAQLDQVDKQLSAALPVARGRLAAGPLPVPPGQGPNQDQQAASFSDLYVANVRADGTRLVIVASRNAGVREPTLPALSTAPEEPSFDTVGSTNGGVGRWRAVLLRGPNGSDRLLLAVPLDQVEATTDDVRWALVGGGLAVFAVLLLAGWWVLHLGLRPIAEVTHVADAIADGERNRRAIEVRGGTEAARLARAVNTMLDQRLVAEDRLRQFVADASHELRTPVAAIRGFTDLYRCGGLADGEALGQAMRRIGQETLRMGGLVDDLLLLASLDQGRPLDTAPVDISALLADAALDASATHPSRQVTVDAQQGLIIAGDEARLRQVFANLLANALTHAGPDASVRVTARSADAVCTIEIADDGLGMDADSVAHAFDRFWRGDVSRVRNRSGSGLGLSIVQAIVEAHRGRIALDSTPAGGTRVRIALRV